MTEKPPSGMVDIADTVVDEADALDADQDLVWDNGRWVKHPRLPASAPASAPTKPTEPKP